MQQRISCANSIQWIPYQLALIGRMPLLLLVDLAIDGISNNAFLSCARAVVVCGNIY
jgi:hypothetical protein